MKQTSSGFSAVELLVTIFVAVAFVATGYQLYSVIIRNSADARMRSRASNVAYEILRLQTLNVAPDTCAASTPSATLPADHGIQNASVTVAITCPFGTSSKTSEVEVSLRYGTKTPQEEVVHAVYAKN
jgi:Tfp pilus assembly protein PilV